jgi:hypothetical protein
MAHANRRHRPASEVDNLIDENASRVDVPDESHVVPAGEREPTVGATGPTNWWRTGVIALAIVAAILLLLQLAGGWPGTAVQPGTPVADPQVAPAVEY